MPEITTRSKDKLTLVHDLYGRDGGGEVEREFHGPDG